MRNICLVFLLVNFFAFLRADVVYDGGNSTGATASDANYVNNLFTAQGQSIKNLFVDAQHGTRIDSISFYLFKANNTTLDGAISLKLYASTGSPGALVPTGPAIYTYNWMSSAQANVNIQSNDISDPVNNFVGGLQTANLSSLNWVLQGDNHFIYTLEYSGTAKLYFNYEKNGVPGSENASFYDATTFQWVDDTGKNMAGSVIGTTVAVPEPSTFVLALLAAAGGAGAWWVRRKTLSQVLIAS